MDKYNIGNEIQYCGKLAIIIDEDKTHILIQLSSGTKIATPKSLHKIINKNDQCV